jgi:hypothetical protein
VVKYLEIEPTGMAKKKKPPTPRRMRMNREGRFSSARHWLATQKNRTPIQIAKAYRKWYGVDWPCAIRELASLGIILDPSWVERLNRTLAGHYRARARRKAARQPHPLADESNEVFAYIAGYTENGVPFGVTWEEWHSLDSSASQHDLLTLEHSGLGP